MWMGVTENPLVPTFGEAIGSFGLMAIFLMIGLFVIYRMVEAAFHRGRREPDSKPRSDSGYDKQ